MEGWIKLYRALLKKSIWLQSTPEQKTILIALLMLANHEENQWEWNGKKFKALPGQFVTSLESIKDACGKGVSIQNVRTALTRFKNLEFLTDESTKSGRLITILNWDVYQEQPVKTNKDDNSQVTKGSQRPNKDLTPNKNDKNVRMKEDNKVIRSSTRANVAKYADTVFLTDEEYSRLMDEFKESGVKRLIEILDAYKCNTPRKTYGKTAYLDDNKVIRGWVIDRYNEEGEKRNNAGNRQSTGTASGSIGGASNPSRIRKAGD